MLLRGSRESSKGTPKSAPEAATPTASADLSPMGAHVARGPSRSANAARCTVALSRGNHSAPDLTKQRPTEINFSTRGDLKPQRSSASGGSTHEALRSLVLFARALVPRVVLSHQPPMIDDSVRVAGRVCGPARCKRPHGASVASLSRRKRNGSSVRDYHLTPMTPPFGSRCCEVWGHAMRSPPESTVR